MTSAATMMQISRMDSGSRSQRRFLFAGAGSSLGAAGCRAALAGTTPGVG